MYVYLLLNCLTVFRLKPKPLSFPQVRSPFSKKKKTGRGSVIYESRTLPAPPKPPHTKPILDRNASYDQSLNPFSEENEELADSDSENLDNRMNKSLCESATASASSRESLDVSGGASIADSVDSGLDARVDAVECSGSVLCPTPDAPDTPDMLVNTNLEAPSTTQQAQNQELVL